MSCPFCPLEHRTEWYATTPDGLVICRDLNNRGFKYRILVVGSGEDWHRPKKDYSNREIKRMFELGKKIAIDHIKDKKAEDIEHINTEHFSYPEHFHLQLVMR